MNPGRAVVIASLLLGAGAASAQQNDRQTIRVGGRDRTYVVRVPSAVRGATTKVPLVIALHGGAGNARNAERMTGFTTKANAEGFIVVYPEGTSRRGPLLAWNAKHCCGYPMQTRVDDVGFIRALIAHLVATLPIDPKRVYATGMSNGAMMSHRLGAELSDQIAAIAPVAGAVFGDEQRPSVAVSALMLNGLDDTSVPFGGGKGAGTFANTWDGTPAKPSMEQAGFWASVNKCEPKPAFKAHARYVTYTHTCPTGIAVELYAIPEHGHAWPRGGIDATDVIWSFFNAHPKP